MEPLSTLSITAIIISSIGATWSLVRMYFEYTSFDRIKITRKDTGKSVTISARPNRNNSKKLLKLVD